MGSIRQFGKSIAAVQSWNLASAPRRSIPKPRNRVTFGAAVAVSAGDGGFSLLETTAQPRLGTFVERVPVVDRFLGADQRSRDRNWA